MLCKATQEACERDMYVRMQSLLQYVLQGTCDINPAVTPRSPQRKLTAVIRERKKGRSQRILPGTSIEDSCQADGRRGPHRERL